MRHSPVEVRFERKFLVSDLSFSEVLAIIRRNKGMFREIFHERAINNIYYDTPALTNYFENVDGATHRRKARVRWYGHLSGAIPKPVLEFKIKNGLPGSKEAYPLAGFDLGPGPGYWQIPPIFERAKLPGEVNQETSYMVPALVNRYHRRYFQSADGLYRTTVDFNLQFYGVRGNRIHYLCKCRPIPHMVLEIKYAPEHDRGAELVSRGFPFRLSQMSKYVMGVEALHGC